MTRLKTPYYPNLDSKNINMQQVVTSIPDLLYEQLLDFSESRQITQSEAIVQILSDYFDILAQKKQLNQPMSQSDWDSLPDDEPDEILWDFLPPERQFSNNQQKKDSLDEPDEVLSDFLDD